MTLKQLYFATLGVSPSLFTGVLSQITSDPQNTFFDYSKIQSGSAKDRPSLYFPKKTNSYLVVILGDENYDLEAAKRLVRSVRYADYVGLPFVYFTTPSILTKHTQAILKMRQGKITPKLNLLKNNVLLAHILRIGSQPQIFLDGADIYNELRKLRPVTLSEANAKLPAKILNLPEEELDLILNQPAFWQLRLFTDALTHLLASQQLNKQPLSGITKSPAESRGILEDEAQTLIKTYNEFLSAKVEGKIQKLDQIDKPQTILNLAKKYQQTYALCRQKVFYLRDEKFSSETENFALAFSGIHLDIMDYILTSLEQLNQQLKKIPENQRHIKDIKLTGHISDPSAALNEFFTWSNEQKKLSNRQTQATATPTEHSVYRFRADLVGAHPKIWRRFEIDGHKNMLAFAEVIMTLFNMEGSHLYSLTNFIGDQNQRENMRKITTGPEAKGVKGLAATLKKVSEFASTTNVAYLMPGEEKENFKWRNVEVQPGETLLKDSHAKEKTRFRFEYDFGDDWQVNLWVEKIRTVTTAGHVPTRVLKGKGSGIIEDIGGIPGLMDYQNHPENSYLLDGAADFQDFDIDEMNELLQELEF